MTMPLHDGPTDNSPWVPVSGFEEAGGYVWLPRLLSKARRSRVGDMNGYMVFGDSPIDRFALGHWRVGRKDLFAWIDAGLGDEAIADRIGLALGEDLAARQAWSSRFKLLFGLFVTALDADEGRLPPGPLTTALKGLITVTFRVVMLVQGRKG